MFKHFQCPPFTRNKWVYIFLIACVIFSANTSFSQSKPNIILIITDDQRWDALGYAGNPLADTPQMDRLASEGIYFKNAFSSTPICAASRASIFTGLYERTHDYTFRKPPLQKRFVEMSYPSILRDNEYQTAFYGKLGVNIEGENRDKMFDEAEFYDRNGRFKDHRGYFYKDINGDTVHLTRYTGQQGIDYIEQADKSKPFCLTLSFSAPHAHDPAPDQYFWQQQNDVWLRDVTVPPAPLSDEEHFLAQPNFIRDGFNRTRWHWRYDTPEKYQHSVKGYHRMIRGIDTELGKLREALAEKNLDDNTIIILIGDNGYFLGERQLAGKWLMYENSIRIPIIIYDPSAGHKDIDEMVLNVDLAPTILSYAGVKPSKNYQGEDLSVYSKNKSVNRDEVLIEHLWDFEHIAPSEGIRTEKWKYMRYVNRNHEELYNLENDPGEEFNLMDSKNKMAIKLRKKLEKTIAKNSDIK